MVETLDETCRKTNCLLKQWQGGYACLWEYSVSLSILTVRVVSDDRPGNLHVICTPTLYICGPVHWENCHLEIATRQTPEGWVEYVLRDERAPFQPTCLSIATEG